MKTLLFTSPRPGAGKTGVLAALALRAAYDGRRVLALRLEGAGADADATTLAALPFGRGRGGKPVSVVDIELLVAAEAARPLDLLFLEGDPGPLTANAVETFDAQVVLVGRGSDDDIVGQMAAGAAALGARLAGIIVTAAPAKRLEALRQAFREAELPLLALLPEDRTLAAPSIGALVDALDGEVILGEPDFGQTIEHLLINPITADPGQPYYARKRNKAVITRSERTDLQLAALQTQTDMLILTGGFPPSPYTIDRAAGEEVVLVLTKADTNESMARISDAFASSRFSGELKVERMGELLQQHGEGLDARLT